MAVNTDLPVLSIGLAHLVAHESYPGHHTEHTRKEVGPGPPPPLVGGVDLPRRHARSASWPRASPTWASRWSWAGVPNSEVAEHLRPLGIRYDADTVAAVAEAGEALGAVRQNAAFRLHEDGADPDVVVAEVARWGLLPTERAAKAVEFLTHPTWRAYLTCYVEGLPLCRAFVPRRSVRGSTGCSTEQLTPEDLQTQIELDRPASAPGLTPARTRLARPGMGRTIAAMSERTRTMPRRSCMSTPGSNERFLAKAPTVPADMSFLDLEDSVAPLEKEAARAKVADAIKNLPWDDRVLCVRINAWDTEWTYGDVIEVVVAMPATDSTS